MTNNIEKNMITTNSRRLKFYITSKFKKGNPNRPVISSVDSHTSNISRYAEYHLQPIVKQMPSYLKHTNDFISKVQDLSIPKDSMLVSLDVKSLYKTLPAGMAQAWHLVGIAAVRCAHKKYQQKTVAAKVLATFLALTRTLNEFIFDSNFYSQGQGHAMDTNCAPFYANIFMEYFVFMNI